jgi:hypothetical protein
MRPIQFSKLVLALSAALMWRLLVSAAALRLTDVPFEAEKLSGRK